MYKILKNTTKYRDKDNIMVLYHNRNKALNFIKNNSYFNNCIIFETRDLISYEKYTLKELKKCINFNNKKILFLTKINNNINDLNYEYKKTEINFFKYMSRLVIQEKKVNKNNNLVDNNKIIGDL